MQKLHMIPFKIDPLFSDCFTLTGPPPDLHRKNLVLFVLPWSNSVYIITFKLTTKEAFCMLLYNLTLRIRNKRWLGFFSFKRKRRLSFEFLNLGIGNGYPCFVISIVFIGLCTAVIGDIAGHLGCFIFLRDSVNAIAFVALGTSVPGIYLKNKIFYFMKNNKQCPNTR